MPAKFEISLNWLARDFSSPVERATFGEISIESIAGRRLKRLQRRSNCSSAERDEGARRSVTGNASLKERQLVHEPNDLADSLCVIASVSARSEATRW